MSRTREYLRGEAGVDTTIRSHARQPAVLLLAEDQNVYVASIISRRAKLPGRMWDLDNTQPAAARWRDPHYMFGAACPRRRGRSCPLRCGREPLGCAREGKAWSMPWCAAWARAGDGPVCGPGSSPARRRSPGVMIVSGPGRSRIMASTVADVMVPTLRASGARRVYGIPGNSLNGFTLTRCTGTARSSGSTSGMRRPRDSRPAAEAALTGEVAVCAASLWAGNLHLINGLAIRRPGGKAGSWKTRCGRRSGTTARRWSRWPPPGTSCRCRPGSPTARSTASPSTGPGPSRPGSEELIELTWRPNNEITPSEQPSRESLRRRR